MTYQTRNMMRNRGLVAVLANGASASAMLSDLTTAFAGFREKNDNRLGKVESSMDDISQALAALRVGGNVEDSHDPDAKKERNAVGLFIKLGDESGIKALATPKAGMSTDSNPDGGYVVTPTISGVIQKRLFDVSPMARLARRVTITNGDAFEEPIDPSDVGAEWVGETDQRPALDTSKLKYLRVPLEEIYTNQPVTQRLLDDSYINIGEWITDKIGDKFASSEGAAYVGGDGVKKPRGLLTYPTSLEKDSVRDWWTMQHINTGAAGAFKAASTTVSPADALYDVVYSLRAPYRANARWLMNLSTAGVVRKLKDSEGRFIWADAREGQPATLCGFPVELDEEMPDIAADSLSIAFGDFRQAYIIIDRPGLRMMRDPYTAKPHVLFYAYRRVGGGLQNGEAVKLLRFSATG